MIQIDSVDPEDVAGMAEWDQQKAAGDHLWVNLARCAVDHFAAHPDLDCLRSQVIEWAVDQPPTGVVAALAAAVVYVAAAHDEAKQAAEQVQRALTAYGMRVEGAGSAPTGTTEPTR